MSHIFVSHATKDDKAVSQIVSSLETNSGRKFWVDHKDLKPPQSNWRTPIHNALQSCSAGLLILSRNSISRPEIVSEWTYLLNTNHDLFVLKIDDVPIEDIDYRLHIVQGVDLLIDWNAGVLALAQYIREGTFPVGAPIFHARPITGRIDRRLTRIPISGRNEDLMIIKDKLRKGPTTIVGVGGLGKSRLAAEVVMTSEGVQGAVWHTASDVSRPDDALELLREHFSLELTASRKEILIQLRTHKRLVVLDNAEAVSDDRRAEYVHLVDDLYDAGAQVLLTSRNQWEEIEMGSSYRPLTLTLEASKNIVLDMQVAFETPDLSRYSDDLAKAARLHPRLIEWAVRQIKRFPVEKVLQDLRELKSQKVQEALDEMIRKTMRQMTEQEGQETELALKPLAVCRGGFTFEAAEEILELGNDTDKIYRLLDILQSWQFVIFDAQRYAIDPLVVLAIGEDKTAYSAHYHYYIELLQRSDAIEKHSVINKESANFQAVFIRTLIDVDVDAFSSLTSAMTDFFSNHEEPLEEWSNILDKGKKILQEQRELLEEDAKTIKVAQNILKTNTSILSLMKKIVVNETNEIVKPNELFNKLQKKIGSYKMGDLEWARDNDSKLYAFTQEIRGIAGRLVNDRNFAITCLHEAKSHFQQVGLTDKAHEIEQIIKEMESEMIDGH